MIKDEVMKDLKFKQRCGSYGVRWDDFYIYENIIILNTPKKDIFVLLDDNYNTIGILNLKDVKDKEEIEKYILGYKKMYNLVDKENGLSFPYPFQDFSLSEIVELGNRTSIYKNDIIVNGKLVIDKNKYNNTYILLLSYIKFLGDQIEQYFLNFYSMTMMGFDYPDIYSYVKSLMNNIEECINLNIEQERQPFPTNIIEYLGQNSENIEIYWEELYYIIVLLLKEKGYEIEKGFEHYLEIRKIDKENIDLSEIAMKLLKILEVPKVENKKTFDMEAINLQNWLEEDLSKVKKLK